MNEEIVVAIGGSTSGLATALRGVKGMVAEAGKSIKEGFSGIFEHLSGELTAAFSVGGVIAEFEKLSNRVEQIKRSAETLQVSDEFVQKLQNVGKTAGISGDAIETMMRKFLMKLPAGSDVEEQFEEFADKIAAIQDPAERARAAVEAFGKEGVAMIPILKNGKAGLDELAKGFYSLSDSEIEAIEQGHQKQEQLESGLDKFFAKAIYGWSKIAEIIGNIPWGNITKGKFGDPGGLAAALAKTQEDDYQNMIDEGDSQRGGAASIASEKLRRASEAQHQADSDAIDDYMKFKKEMDFKHATPKDQLKMLEGDRGMLQLQANGAEGAARWAIEKQILVIDDQILDTKKKISDEDKEAARKQKEVDDDKKKRLQEEREINKSIAADRERIVSLRENAKEVNANAQYATLQQVANSGYAYVNGSATRWRQGPLAQEAQQVLSLEARAQQERAFGNFGDAKADESQASKLRKDLEASGAIAPTMTEHLKSIRDDIAKTQIDIADLTSKAKTDGLKIQWPDE